MKHATIRPLLATTFALFLLLTAATQAAFAQVTTAFTYQGRLTDNSTLASGAYDLQFALFDAASDGAQQGANVTLSNVSVTNGIFTVALDFGSAPFATGAPRFLQISVRPGGSSSAFTLLTPRQALAPTPYAIRSQSAATADTATNATNATNATTATNANQLGGVDANQYVTGAVVRNVNGLSGNITLAAGANVTLTPSGNTLTIAANGDSGGTGNFIQNTTTPQAASNFNISGNGTAGGTLTASTVSGGMVSGGTVSATTQFNLNGLRILGAAGGSNIFVGHDAGTANTTGSFNSFVGVRAGKNVTTGSGNVFLGNDTGLGNATGNSNTAIGSGANVAGNLAFATAIGSLAAVTTDNTIVLGRSADTVQIPGLINAATQYNLGGNRVLAVTGAGQNLNSNTFSNTFAGVGAGTNTTPSPLAAGNANSFFGNQAGTANTTGFGNAFVGQAAGQANATGNQNAFVGLAAGFSNTTGSNNTYIGNQAGIGNSTGSNNTIIGSGADVGGGGLSFATAIGAGAVVSTSNTIALGRSDGSDKVRIYGLGAAGSTQLCRNANNEIATCSSSLRYKTAISPYRSGLDLINRLQPISFTWKEGGLRDLGFGAEDVAKIDPLLAVYNKEGQVEGVKYDRLSALLVNAVKEQQAQINAQQQELATLKSLKAENAELKTQLEQLRQIVCGANPTALLCQPVR